MADSATRRIDEKGAEPAPPLDAASTAPSARAAGSSVQSSGSSRTRAAEVFDNDKTVISKRPPISDSAVGMSRAASPSEMGRILVGERLGHFQLEEFVGGGGMGAVFRATDMMLGRTVAVKVLSRDQTQETLERFTREARNAALLDHERIARVYYVNEDKGWHYIVFEYIEGVNVRDLVDAHGPLSIDESLYVTLQVTEALRHAAQKEVVHRDIKPSNILIMPDGRAKLVDMGLAHSRQVEASQNELTESGVTLGTFDYISPEQAREPRSADVRSDIYSLGCTLYYMLTGRPPFPEGTVLQKLISHNSDPPPDPRQYRPDIPDEVFRLLMRMLAKNPTQRFQKPDDLIDEILRIAGVLGLERTSMGVAGWVQRPQTPAPWYEKHLPWAAPVITLVLLIIGLEWFAGPPPAQQPPRPNLLPPITQASKPPGPLIPVARNTVKPAVEKTTDKTADSSEKPAELPEKKPATTADTETPAESGNKTESSEPAPPVVVSTLIVGPSKPHKADTKIVATLAEAIEALAKMPDVKTIELHFDGERADAPVALTAANITIRAAENAAGVKFKPVLVYRPTLASARTMIDLDAKAVAFQDVQFRLELPQESTGDRWSLFGLEEDAELALERCALTIDNADDEGSRLQLAASFFDVVEPDELNFDELGLDYHRPHINLQHTLARGEATLISSDAGFPFKLVWGQGFLATPGHLADVGGSTGQFINDLNEIFLDFNRVTIHARSGLCLMRSRADADRHLKVVIVSSQCIYFTDPSAPLIEHRTLQDVDALKRKFPRLTGDSDIFTGGKIYWRITPQGSAVVSDPLNIPLSDAQLYGLSEGDGIKSRVMWNALPPLGRPVHAYLKSDYLLSTKEDNPDNRGFEPSELPEFYTESPAPSKPREPTSSETTPANSPTVPPSGVSDKMKMMMTPATPKPAPPPPETPPPPSDEE